MSSRIRVVCATRQTPETFTTTALGRSLALYRRDVVQLRLFDGNQRGLPAVYNEAIAEARTDPAILVFVHDDVFLVDFFWLELLARALTRFDIVGLAGNKRRVPRQPAWVFPTESLRPDRPENLTGVVGHGPECPPEVITYFGPPGQEVKLLDGLLLAVRSETLVSRGLSFDERFDFHFYDMDFCRQAELLGLRMGTVAMTVVHQSPGRYTSDAWRGAYAKYLQKWQE